MSNVIKEKGPNAIRKTSCFVDQIITFMLELHDEVICITFFRQVTKNHITYSTFKSYII